MTSASYVPAVRRRSRYLQQLTLICLAVAMLSAAGALVLSRTASAANSQPSGFQALAFVGKGGPGDAVYGPNEPVDVIAGFGYYPICAKGGQPDRGLPLVAFSDIWVVPSDDPVLTRGGSFGAKAVKHTAAPALGLFGFGETIGVTAPTGQLGPGTYTVIFDECQDGTYDPSEDARWDAAFRVALPDVLPPVDPGLAELKTKSAEVQGTYFPAYALCRSRDAAKLYKGATSGGFAGAVLSVGYPLIIPQFNQPDECVFTTNIYNHFKAIANDPPDPAFARPTAVRLDTAGLTPSTEDSTASSGTRLDALLEALLHSVERYQGARSAGDAGWAVQHLREAAFFSRSAADAATVLGSATSRELEQLAAETPDLDTQLSESAATRERWLADGMSDADRRELLNAGLSPADLDQVLRELRSTPAPAASLAELRGQARDVRNRMDGISDTLRAFGDRVAELAAGAEKDVPVAERSPIASAGGPYDRNVPVLRLDSSNSSAPPGRTVVRSDWDLDGDGSFDDATGTSPVVSADVTGPLVGVRVLDSAGRAAISYAPVRGDAGAITGSSPGEDVVTVEPGHSADFSVSPRAGLTVQWSVDGQAAASGSSYRFTPVLQQGGLRAVSATVSRNGRPVTGRTWNVVVPAPDADGDGWRANVDCDDTTPGASFDDCSLTYQVSRFGTDLGSVTGVSFDPSGRLVAANGAGDVFRLPPEGGTGPESRIGSSGHGLLGLAHIGARLFATAQNEGKVFELDPLTGSVLRVVVDVDGPTGIAYDRSTGDLVVGSVSAGGIFRIANPLSVTPSVTKWASGLGTDGIAVGPDGTVYAAEYQEGIWILGAADGPHAGETLQEIRAPAADGIALELRNGRTVALFVNGTSANNGRIDRFDLTTSPPRQTRVFEAGGYGDFTTVGPDGCMYATNPALGVIHRVRQGDGTCNLAPTNGSSSVSLSPSGQSHSVGDQAELAIRVSPPRSTTVTVRVAGSNATDASVTTADDGTATFAYRGQRPGSDSVTAHTSDGAASESVSVDWEPVPNRAPTVQAEAMRSRQARVSVPVETNDPDGDDVSVRILDGPAHGAAEISNGRLVYTPDRGYLGPDQVVLLASDGQAESGPTPVPILVTSADALPTAEIINVSTPSGTPTTVTLRGSDAEGPVRAEIPKLDAADYHPPHGQLGEVDPNGSVTYEPEPGYTGPDGFVYDVVDSAGQRGTGLVVVTVGEAGGGPTGPPDPGHPGGSGPGPTGPGTGPTGPGTGPTGTDAPQPPSSQGGGDFSGGGTSGRSSRAGGAQGTLGNLPFTGADLVKVLALATVSLTAGAVLLVIASRRPRRT